jgi:predicted component of type VI protein secretion system
VAKLVISRDAQVVQELELGEGRMTIGRHAASEIVLDHQAVSGRHAAITVRDGQATLEDTGSSNGTFVNGQRIARILMADGDRIAVAAFRLEFVAGPPSAVTAPAQAVLGSIEVMNGASAGKTLTLLKPLTTLGSPGVLVVVISRQAGGYYIEQVQGDAVARVNDAAISRSARLLCDGDVLELTGTRLRFSTGLCRASSGQRPELANFGAT